MAEPESGAQQVRAQPESFRGQRLSASLTVKDLAASLGWYRDLLGFTVTQEYQREGALFAVSLAAGDARVLLTQDDGARGWDRVKGQGISLMITTAQDVDERANHIKARGGTLEDEPADTPWGARMFRVRDPDGFLLTISSGRSAAN